MELDLSLFRLGSLNIMKYDRGFPWEKIIVDAMRFGISTYIILGNFSDINFRILHVTLKRLKLDERILIRRGFTYYQLLEVVMDLSSYHDFVLFFHDPVSFQDLSAEERFVLSQAVMLNLHRYAETHGGITVFAHTENFNVPYGVSRITARAIKNGWKVTSGGAEKFIYFDPSQVSLDYFMEV